MSRDPSKPNSTATVPWHALSGTRLAERICTAYGEHLLDSIPFVPDVAQVSAPLVNGYRALDRARAETAWRYHEACARRLTSTSAVLLVKAEAASVTWEVVHLHLVALQLAEMYAAGADGPPSTHVRWAERAVEALALDIEVVGAP
jgi:hypothetical protein